MASLGPASDFRQVKGLGYQRWDYSGRQSLTFFNGVLKKVEDFRMD